MVSNKSFQNWEKSGKHDFVNQIKKRLEKHGNKINLSIEKKVETDFYKLIWEVLDGEMKADQAVWAAEDISVSHEEFVIMLSDLLSIIDIEVACQSDSAVQQRFIALVSAMRAVIPECFLKEKMDVDTLENAHIIPSKTAYTQKYVKIKTKLYYKQQKFNLMREESEGYAKLVTELSQPIIESKSLHDRICSLIGFFNLDPNRVVDIILDVFECHPTREDTFIPIIKECSIDPTTLSHVLGFKYHSYEPLDNATASSLYHITAVLLKHQLVSLHVLLSHLHPSHNMMLEEHKKEVEVAKKNSLKQNFAFLNDNTDNAFSNKDNSSDKTTNNNNNPSDTNEAVVDGVAEKKEEEDDDIDVSTPNPESNQKLGLCEALIMIGCWSEAQVIIQSLPPYMAVSRASVSEALCKLIDYMLEPLYTKEIINKHPLYMTLRKNHPSNHNEGAFPASVPQVKDYSDLPSILFPIVNHLGPYLSTNTVLMLKLNRLAVAYLTQYGCHKAQVDLPEVFRGWMSVYEEVMLPSLSCFQAHCPLSNDLWEFISLLKSENRYRLYWLWKGRVRQQTPLLITSYGHVVHRTKHIMKRIAKDNVKPLGRQIGKLSHTCPGVVFELMLGQIQIFNNLIIPVVDSLRFLSPMSYDVLAYHVIEALANPERERLKTDGTNISTWLQSLASFSATVFKKYQVDMCAFLQYVCNQLKAGKSYDLYILKEVIQKMAGIEVSEDCTMDQLLSMTGGELLKQEGSYFTQVRNTKKTSNRLLDSLQDQNLTIPLCLLMAQQRNNIVYPTEQQLSSYHTPLEGMPLEDKRPIKLITNLYDQCQDALVQYMSFIQLHTSTQEMKSKLPDLLTLSHDYHISPEVAFALWRPIFTSDINAKADELSRRDKREMGTHYYEAVEAIMLPVRKNLVCHIGVPRLCDELSVHFYTTFWSLELYDLEVPVSTYENQIKGYEMQLASIEHNKEFSQSKKRKDKEKERCVGIIERLKEEMKRQQDHVDLVALRLKTESANWFQVSSKPTTVLQQCIFPRTCFTDVDALYSAKFLNVAHFLDAPNLSSLICYDKIFTDLTWCLTSCTENEAHRYGRFLNAVLTDVMRWYSDKNIYDKECLKYSGFKVTVKVSSGNQGSAPNQLDYNNFRGVIRKWHYEIFKAALNFIESGEYIQIRNMLILLTKILPNSPKFKSYGDLLEKKVKVLVEAEKDKRKDLFIHASVYLGQLKATSKNWMKEEPMKHVPKQANNLPKPTPATTTTTTPANVSDTTTTTTTTTTDSTTASNEAVTPVKDELAKLDADRLKRLKGVEMRMEGTRIKAPIRAPLKEPRHSPPGKNDERRWEKQDERKEVFRRDDVKSASGNTTPTTGGTNVVASNSGSKYYSRGDESPRKSRMTYEEDHHHNRHRSVENSADRDTKRRKMDATNATKDSADYYDNRDRGHKSPSSNHSDVKDDWRRTEEGRGERKRHSRNNQEFGRDALNKRMKTDEVAKGDDIQEDRKGRLRERREEVIRELANDHKEVKPSYKDEHSLREPSQRVKKGIKRGSSEKRSKKNKER